MFIPDQVRTKVCAAVGLAGFIFFSIKAVQLSSGSLDPSTQLSSSPFRSTSTYNSSSTNLTTHFQDQPTYRGTVGIITTCLSTLVLCVWTALHLNLPEPELDENVDAKAKGNIWHAGWRKFLKTIARFEWVVLGIFIPEFIAYTAWTQFLSAHSFNREILEVLGEKDKSAISSNDRRSSSGDSAQINTENLPPRGNGSRHSADEEIAILQHHLTSSPRRHKWTKVHSFYALMGGFAFDLRGQSPFIPGSSYQTLGPEGVFLLAKTGLLPDISEQDIRDKSKTDGLGQFITCSQAIWLVIQCVGRFKLGLFITTLELNTIGHVLCALVTFILWWNKPFQVKEPTLIYGKDAREICAYMWMTSSISSVVLKIHDFHPELESVDYRPDQIPLTPDNNEEPSQTSTTTTSPSNQGEFNLSAGQRLPGSNFYVSSNSKRFFETTYYIEQIGLRPEEVRQVRGQDRALPKIIHFNPLDAERWRLASAAMSNPAYNNLFPYQDTKKSRQFILRRPENISEGSGVFDGSLWRGCAAFTPVAAGYAGVHAIAWNYTFATVAEQTMWRLSVVYLSAVLALLLLYGFYSGMTEWLKWKEVDYWVEHQGWRGFIFQLFLSLSLCFFTFGYAFARVYLVVESFIGLRCVPPDAYLVPQWSQVIPHL